MKIELYRDYWREYYELKRLIEQGKSRNFDGLRYLRELAEAKAETVKANWRALGIRA